MAKDEILKTLEFVKQEVRRKYKAEIKGIFGSYSRGEEKESSDLYVLVELLEGATFFDLAGQGTAVIRKIRITATEGKSI